MIGDQDVKVVTTILTYQCIFRRSYNRLRSPHLMAWKVWETSFPLELKKSHLGVSKLLKGAVQWP